MTTLFRSATTFVLAASAAFSLGCLPAAKPPVKPADEHAHHHHGPHGGHVYEIGDEEYHAEITHDDSGHVTVFLLDKEVKKPVTTTAEKITITITTTKKGSADSEAVAYDLLPVNRTEGEMPAASQFEITDKTLLGQLESLTPKAIDGVLDVEINGKAYKAKLEEHEHHH